MQEIAMTLLDIVNNAIRAKADRIIIHIIDSVQNNIIHLEVEDNGCGMSSEVLAQVTNPFYTTRKTRHIGLGIPLFKAAVEATGGKFFLESKENVGTKIIGEYVKNHWDTPPMGDLSETIMTIIQTDEAIDYEIFYQTDCREWSMKTKEIKELLDGVQINEPHILLWLKDYIREGMQA